MALDLNYIETKMNDADLTALTLSNEQINVLITEANNEVDSYLTVRYIFPYEYSLVITIAEAEILRMKFIVFKYWLYAGKYDNEEMKAVQVQYLETIKRLNLIIKGENDIPGLVEINTTPGIFSTNSLHTHHVHKVFHAGRLHHYDN